MDKEISKCSCGSEEFVSNPDRYSTYKLIDGKLEFQKSEIINSEDVISCRECGKKLQPLPFTKW